MLKIGLSCSFELNEETFIALKNAGIEAIEISFRPENIESINYKEVEMLSKKYGIELWSYHLPFWDYKVSIDAASHDEKVREKTIEVWKKYIKLASEIGIKKFIAHPSSEPKSEDPEVRAQEIAYSQEGK